jgi:hypothetical protein
LVWDLIVPSAKYERWLPALHHHGGCISEGCGDVVQAPAGYFVGGSFDAQQGGWDAGAEGDIETGEGESKAFAQGLHVGFLAGPALEEGSSSLGRGEGPQGGGLSGGKETGGDGIGGAFRIDKFNVCADARVEGQGQEGEVAGMGEVELEGGLVEVGGKFGFPLGCIGEGDFGGREV